MAYNEKNQRKAYTKKGSYSISGLNLRLRYMVEDYDKLINSEFNNRKSFIKHPLVRQSPI